MLAAFVGSFLASLASGLGAVPFLFVKEVPHRAYDTLLGFVAGVMVGTTAFTLIPIAFHEGGAVPAVAGMALGVVLLMGLERIVPHLEPHFSPRVGSIHLRLGVLMALALTLHHLPEGLAIGAAYGSENASLGLAVAIAIALQNIPEGLAVAAPLRQGGVSRFKSVAFATASGLVQPVAALAGVAALESSETLVPFGLALAGGAMLWVVVHQLVPEAYKHGHWPSASIGAAVGLSLLTLVRWALG